MNVPDRALVMLAYLYDFGRPMPRKELAALLWPNNLQAAGANLRSTLLRLAAATSQTSKPVINSVSTDLILNFDVLSCDLDAAESGTSKLKELGDAVAKIFSARSR